MCRGRVHCRALRYVELVSLHARYEVPEGMALEVILIWAGTSGIVFRGQM